MRTKTLSAMATALTLTQLWSTEAAGQRSFVGKKLETTFVDTEGYTINPADYEGGVLVMVAGIPW